MQFIDTHQHLIYRDRCGYGWTQDIPALATGDFTTADYAALTAGKGVSGSVFMETGVDDGDYQTEARFVAGLIGQGGMLGQIASCRPETDAGFDAWLAECAGLQVKGFRRILHVVPDDVSQSAVFRRNLRKIGQAGLAFDLCFLARQLPIAADLARAAMIRFWCWIIAACPTLLAAALPTGRRGLMRWPRCRICGSNCRASPPIAHRAPSIWQRCGLTLITSCTALAPTACCGAVIGRWSIWARACRGGST